MSESDSSDSGFMGLAWGLASLWVLYKAFAFWDLAWSLESPVAELVVIVLAVMWVEAILTVFLVATVVGSWLFGAYCAVSDYLRGRDIGVPGGDN